MKNLDNAVLLNINVSKYCTVSYFFFIYLPRIVVCYIGGICVPSVRPGVKYRDVGAVIQRHAQAHNFSVVRSYCGHGIHQLFHTTPSVPHYSSECCASSVPTTPVSGVPVVCPTTPVSGVLVVGLTIPVSGVPVMGLTTLVSGVPVVCPLLQ